MKKILIFTFAAILVLVAGCTTSPGVPAPVPTATPLPAYAIPADALPMNGSITLGNATHQITASVDSFEVSPNAGPGNHTVTIYVNAKNTGNDLIKYTWFSELTDLNGNAYGGDGISHGGNGARSEWIIPNTSEAARDYVIVNSDRGLAALANGAVLDVYFYEQKADGTHPLIPDYHITWIIDPDIIR